MQILHVHIHVKAEHLAEFIEATKENADNSRKEPGIARFDLIQQTDDPTRLVLVEVYRTPGDQAKHKETPHYNTWSTKTADWFAEPRTRTLYTNISPADQGW
jgi:quinol monooxygenase YgiN